MDFVRDVDDKLLDNLKKEKLFNDYLIKDIYRKEQAKSKNIVVFPAIRNNEIHFYYAGGRLFKFTNNGFISNVKFAFVFKNKINDKKTEGDIFETDLSNKKIKLIENFCEGYENIKERCALHNKGLESSFVSKLFKDSYLNPQSDIVLLDIEASFDSFNEDKYQDRVDVVLYNKTTKTIKFVEAKLFTNNDIKTKEDDAVPNVVNQIKGYDGVINRDYDNILEAYQNCVKKLNSLFNIELPLPKNIDRTVGLLIFDFDGDNKNASLINVKNKLEQFLPNHKIYANGHMDSYTLDDLFDCVQI